MADDGEVKQTSASVEPALRAQERYRDLVENINDVLFSLDEKGVVTYISPVVRSVTGYESAEVAGRSFAEFVHPEDLASLEESFRRTKAGDIHPSEYRIFDKRGLVRWVRSFSRPILDGVRVVGVRGVLTDVTDRKTADLALAERERHFRLLIEHSSDLVALLRDSGVVSYTGPSIQRILGYGCDELVGRNAFDLVHPQDRDASLDLFSALVRRPGASVTVHFRFLHKNSSWRWLEGIGTNLLAEPSVGAIIVNSRDITERRRAEEEARQRQAELAHVLRVGTVGEMTAGLAHELNQPLSAIVNYAKGCVRRLSVSGQGSPEVLHALHEIAAEAMRAGDIMHGLKRFVRKAPQRRSVVDLNDVVRDALRWVEGEARKREIALSLDLAPDLAPARVDRIQIEQVILNLVRNGIEAVAANGARGGELTVRTAARTDGVEVAVRDNGSGVPPSLTERIFSPFYSTKPNGLGMGLAISRAIIESHSGTLCVVDGEPGATFLFHLPSAIKHAAGE